VLRAARGEGATIFEATTRPLLDREGDPMVRLRQHLEANKLWSEKDERDNAARVRAELDVAIAAAASEPPPPRESMFDDVYAGLPWHLRAEREGGSRGEGS